MTCWWLKMNSGCYVVVLKLPAPCKVLVDTQMSLDTHEWFLPSHCLFYRLLVSRTWSSSKSPACERGTRETFSATSFKIRLILLFMQHIQLCAAGCGWCVRVCISAQPRLELTRTGLTTEWNMTGIGNQHTINYKINQETENWTKNNSHVRVCMCSRVPVCFCVRLCV